MAKSKKSSIVLITNHFPFGPFESFLEQEIPHLTAAFDQVIILARDIVSKEMRRLSGVTVYRINPESNWKEKLLIGWLLIKNAPKVLAYIRDENHWLAKRKNVVIHGAFGEMIHVLIKGLVTSYHIERILKEQSITYSVTLYSYWLTSSALATTFVQLSGLDIKRISRAHGGDVYEHRHTYKYLPFRRVLALNLDKIFAISTDGCEHLRRQLSDHEQNKITTSRLGTARPGLAPKKVLKEFTLVSCSFLVPVKRVDLLIDALSHLDQTIHWIHIGDGAVKDNVESRARQVLSAKSNIRFTFLGNLTLSALYDFYRSTYVDLFINTSSSEGIPVTMMEAQSFGIPIVGPNVGGVPEIVNDYCGRLFPVDATPTQIANKITEILGLPLDIYQAMRNSAFQNWDTRYNAENNFSTFVAEIQKL
ncbi:MAG: glycosyltransferase [Chryseolinea sp.]